MTQKNRHIEQNLKVAEDMGKGRQFTVDDVDDLIKPTDPFSEKVVHCVAKYKALDECMISCQKAFDKDAIDLSEFLKCIRQLAAKQCKQIGKMERLNKAINPSGQEQFRGYQM
jgi:hypothetical protein